MKDSIYLVVTRRGVDRTCKTGSFSLKPTERAFELKIEIPDEAFLSPPVPVIRIAVPAEALIREVEVSIGDELTEATP